MSPTSCQSHPDPSKGDPDPSLGILASDPRIAAFIRKHHVMTLATCLQGQPWCAHCFYVFLEDEMWLGFTSDPDTRHIKEAMEHECVAASIVLETRVVGKIQGVQIEGRMVRPDGPMEQRIKQAYIRRFPVAAVMDTCFWGLEITSIKMTDNLLGFGKKLFWERKGP